ncbi:MAG TPA: hypothetical protein VIL24_05680 [Clostridia bacterium]
MMKKHLKVLALALSLAFAFVAFQAMPIDKAKAQEENTQTTYALDMVNAIVNANKDGNGLYSARIEGDLFDYQIGYGKVAQNTFKFFNTGAANKLSTSDTEGINSGQYPACVWFDGSQNMLRTNNAQLVIFKLYINKNVTLSIEHESVKLTSAGISGLVNMFAKVYKEVNGTPTILQSKKVYDPAIAEGVITENAYGGTFELAEGDVIYLEFANDGWGRTISSSPSTSPTVETDTQGETNAKNLLPTFKAVEKQAAAVTYNLIDMISASVISNGAAIEADETIDYHALYGTLENQRVFTAIANNALQSAEKNSDGYAAVYAGGASKIIRTDTLKGYNFLIKLVVKKNANIKITYPQTSKAFNNGAKSTFTLAQARVINSKKYYKILDETEIGLTINQDIVHTYNLSAGEELYLMIANSNHGTQLILMPYFEIDETAYDSENLTDFSFAQEVENYITAKKAQLAQDYQNLDLSLFKAEDLDEIQNLYDQAVADITAASTIAGVDAIIDAFWAAVENYKLVYSLNAFDMISATIASKGAAIEGRGVTYHLVYGEINNLKTFDKIQTDSLQTQEIRTSGQYAAVYAGCGASKLVRSDPKKGYNFIVVFTAEQDLKITLTSPVIAQATNGTAYYKVYQGREHENRMYYYNHYSKTVASSDEVTENLLSGEYHLPAGDKLFVVVSAINDTTNVYLLPNYVVDLEGFDADKSFDFTNVINFTKFKDQAIGQVTEELEAIDAENYTESNYNELVGYYNEALAKIEQATTAEQIEAILEKLQANAASVLTKAQIETLKQSYTDQIDEYLAGLKQGDYTAENWEAVLGYVQEFKTALEDMETEHAMYIKYNETINNIERVEKIAKPKKGCGSADAVKLLVMTLTLAAAAIYIKRA